MKETYVVTIDRPENVTVGEMNEFIKESLRIMPQSFHPDNPLFGHFNKHGNTIQVKRVRELRHVAASVARRSRS